MKALSPSSAPLGLLLLCLMALASVARADEVTETWTGDVELRGNYYWERSTRVLAPSVDMNLYAPNGVTLHGDYLVDAITSASLGAGALVDNQFTEIRHEFALAAQQEFDLGEAQLVFGGMGRFSNEPDYRSLSGGLRTELYLFDRATTLRFFLGALHDEIGQVYRGGSRIRPGGDGMTSDNAFSEEMNALTMRFGWTQVLTPVLEVQTNLDFAVVRGYQANPYRTVMTNGTPSPEHYPDQRLRYTLSGSLAYYIIGSGTTIRLRYRAYMDNWKVASLTPEVWIHQELGPFLLGRLRYRYYTQTPAFFAEDDPTNYPRPDGYLTADPKMLAFHSSQLGLQLILITGFLEGTALDWMREAQLDITFDYVWSTSGYGNAVMSQLGLRVPF